MPAEFEYSVRRSARARRVRVRVDLERGVEVVLPARASERAAGAAVAELRPWIERRLGEVDLLRRRLAGRTGWVPYLDERLALVVEEGRTRVHRRGQELLVPAGADAGRAGLERWYRKAAREEVATRLDRATGAAGLRYSGLSIRGQRTRWASCSADGAMSFNWRLLLAPARVLDYVVWHEVCHLEVADHSPGFWALVESRCPDWRESAAWLRRHGAELVL
ncbi:MAG: M48 family metallopeptidase [Actinobacteria bacterium]|nr:M48 family metallopeptidase [Actinomycetota bacterium]